MQCVSHLKGKPALTYEEKWKEPQSLKGQTTLIITVNISGSPQPKITWYLGEQEIVKSDTTTIETTDITSTLTVKRVASSDAGIYKVTAQNEAGEDTAEFTIHVKGNPSSKF